MRKVVEIGTSLAMSKCGCREFQESQLSRETRYILARCATWSAMAGVAPTPGESEYTIGRPVLAIAYPQPFSRISATSQYKVVIWTVFLFHHFWVWSIVSRTRTWRENHSKESEAQGWGCCLEALHLSKRLTAANRSTWNMLLLASTHGYSTVKWKGEKSEQKPNLRDSCDFIKNKVTSKDTVMFHCFHPILCSVRHRLFKSSFIQHRKENSKLLLY